MSCSECSMIKVCRSGCSSSLLSLASERIVPYFEQGHKSGELFILTSNVTYIHAHTKINYDIDLLEMTEAKDLIPKSMRP